jgi:hypothetical protein
MLNEFLDDKQSGVDHQKVKNKLKETSDKIEKWQKAHNIPIKEFDFNKEVFSILAGTKSSEVSWLMFETRIR